jgi:hypothetical protein
MAFQVTQGKSSCRKREGTQNESKTFCKKDVREMQDHKAQGQSHGYL